jgi:hypothetical protein
MYDTALTWLPWVIIVAAVLYGAIRFRKYLDRREELAARQVTPNQISLQVPDSVNLKEMSTEEIEALALEMSRKAAAGLPKGTTLATDRVSLVGRQPGQQGWGISIGWGRSCDAGELDPDIHINPGVFEDPIHQAVLDNPNAKVTIESKLPGA